MSAAACGGGMTESDDDNGDGVSEIPHSLLPSSDEDDEEEAKRTSFLDCLASLEAFLPMKSGLSSHYYGRSKSFGNLTDLSIEDSKGLGKKEHAVNKRRRLLVAHEFREEPPRGGRSSNVTHASSMPVFLSDYCKDEDEEEEGVYDDNKVGNGDKNQEEDRK